MPKVYTVVYGVTSRYTGDMAERKQVGMIDAALLDRADEVAEVRGQTRRVFVERAIRAAVVEADAKDGGKVANAG